MEAVQEPLAEHALVVFYEDVLLGEEIEDVNDVLNFLLNLLRTYFVVFKKAVYIVD